MNSLKFLRTKIYEIDVGIIHYVSARTKRKAIQLSKEADELYGHSQEEIKEYYEEIYIHALTDEDVKKRIAYGTEYRGRSMSLYDYWIKQGKRTQHLVCSEW